MLLNEVEQALFGFEVVVQSSQRHTALARKIAHRRAFITLFAEDFGGMSQNLGQAPVIPSSRSSCGAMSPRGHSGCGGRSRHDAAQLIRTIVRTKYTRV